MTLPIKPLYRRSLLTGVPVLTAYGTEYFEKLLLEKFTKDSDVSVS